jgi:hypothetical protein
MELKFPVGTKLPTPKQKLYTRIDGERVEIWLEKPLSKVAIAKLKARSMVYTFETIGDPAITIKTKGKGLTKAELNALSDAISESGERRIARTLSRSYESIRQYNRSDASRPGTVQDARTVTPDSRRTPDGRRAVEGRTAMNERATTRERETGREAATSRTSTRTPETERRATEQIRTTREDERIPSTERVTTPERRTPPDNIRVPPTERVPAFERRTPPPPPPPPPDKGRGKLPDLATKAPASKRTPEDYAAAVTWKQGLGYWTVFPDKSIEFSMTKPDGVKVVAGPDRNKPGATIQVRNAKPNAKVTTFDADMGIQDVQVRKQSGKILGIKFKQDRKQRTTNRVNLKLHGKSQKRGKVYYTKVSNGQLMSRRAL